uniref:BHLH domain-containing protein n=1 Tax=Leersia perrieri TaxID=77586 RepID=A0A0D9XZI7_9ORYZ
MSPTSAHQVFDRRRLLAVAAVNAGMGHADSAADALRPFTDEPAAAIDDLLAPLPSGCRGAGAAGERPAKRPRASAACDQTTPPPPRHWQVGPDLAAAAKGNKGGSAAARERRRQISEKTAELSRLIPGGARMNSTADMLYFARRYVKFLKAQVDILSLLPSSGEVAMPSMMTAEEQETMMALLASGRVQERLAGEGKCIVPTSFVRAVAGDGDDVLNRELARFINSLQEQ